MSVTAHVYSVLSFLTTSALPFASSPNELVRTQDLSYLILRSKRLAKRSDLVTTLKLNKLIPYYIFGSLIQIPFWLQVAVKSRTLTHSS